MNGNSRAWRKNRLENKKLPKNSGVSCVSRFSTARKMLKQPAHSSISAGNIMLKPVLKVTPITQYAHSGRPTSGSQPDVVGYAPEHSRCACSTRNTNWWPPTNGQPKPGSRQTHRDHYPPEKLPGLERTRESCLAQAAELGPACPASG